MCLNMYPSLPNRYRPSPFLQLSRARTRIPFPPKSIPNRNKIGFWCAQYDWTMISVTPYNPKFRVINRQPKLCPVICSNCIHSLPYPSVLSASNPKFRALKFTPKSPFLRTSGFHFPIIHHRYSTKTWKLSCFRREEFSPTTSNPESAEGILHESDKSEISKPKFERGNWTKILREIIDGIFRQTGKPWIVPWTANIILQVTLLWVVSFWFVGSWMIPFGAHIVGISRASLTFRGQAFFSLLTDVTEGLAGIIILHRCLSPFRPLPPDWFRFSPRGKWLLEVVLGCLMFPLVNCLSQFNLDLLPALTSTPATLSSVEQSIMARDPIAMAVYAVVLVVCAPLWEEIVFRGFLLPSLTRYMPVWCSILVSAVAFALAHFNVQRVIPLIFLGVVMGVTYSRSRNLLPPMLLHSLWNGFVFFDLIK